MQSQDNTTIDNYQGNPTVYTEITELWDEDIIYIFKFKKKKKKRKKCGTEDISTSHLV